MDNSSIPDLDALRQWIGRPALRGVMVWLFYTGHDPQQIAALLDCCERTVSRWVQRFDAEGVEGLHDRPRPGAPRQADDAVAQHLERVLTPDPHGQTQRWTVARLGQSVKERLHKTLSLSTVRRTLPTLRYRWRRPRWEANGEEPERDERLQKVEEALLQAEKGDVVLYEDESSFHLLPVLRCLWMKVGQQLRLPTFSGWNRYFAVFGAVRVDTGEGLFQVAGRKNAQTFIAFLEQVIQRYSGQTVWIILDNVRYHRAEAVVAWLGEHPEVHLVWLPRYDPQSNPIERVWNWLKTEVAGHRSYEDLKPLQDACERQLQLLTPERVLQLTSLAA